MMTTIQHPIFGWIEYDSGEDKVSVQRGDLAKRMEWLMNPENQHLLGRGYWPDTFIRVCEVVGIMQEAESIKTEGEQELHAKTIIEHRLYGRIIYDDETGKVTVQHGQLAERISWLLKPKNYRLLGHGYWPSRFCRACQVLGIMEGVRKVTTSGEEPLPPGTVY
jgi:hypothetical protein